MIEAYRRNLRTFLALCRGNDILPVLSTQTTGSDDPNLQRLVAAMDTFNESVRDLAAAEDVALVDCAARMPWDDKIFYDICHANDGPAGLGRKARVFAQELIEARAIEHAWDERSNGEDVR